MNGGVGWCRVMEEVLAEFETGGGGWWFGGYPDGNISFCQGHCCCVVSRATGQRLCKSIIFGECKGQNSGRRVCRCGGWG